MLLALVQLLVLAGHRLEVPAMEQVVTAVLETFELESWKQVSATGTAADADAA